MNKMTLDLRMDRRRFLLYSGALGATTFIGSSCLDHRYSEESNDSTEEDVGLPQIRRCVMPLHLVTSVEHPLGAFGLHKITDDSSTGTILEWSGRIGAVHPSFSSDGRIIFRKWDDDYVSKVCAARISEEGDLEDLETLVDGFKNIWHPEHSPGISAVSFQGKQRENDVWRVYVQENGKELWDVTEQLDVSFVSDGFTYDQAWSPDGTKLAFSVPTYMRDVGGEGGYRIYVADLLSGTVTQVTSEDVQDALSPSWLSDTELAYVSLRWKYRPNQVSDIRVVDITTQREVEKLTNPQNEAERFYEISPLVSSLESGRIAFKWWNWEDNGISVIDPEKGLQRIPGTYDDGRIGSSDYRTLAWTPDGEMLGYRFVNENTKYGLRLVSFHGLETKDIVNNPNLHHHTVSFAPCKMR